MSSMNSAVKMKKGIVHADRILFLSEDKPLVKLLICISAELLS